MAAGDETYSSGTTPKIHDTERVLLVKLIIAEAAGGGGGGTGIQQFYTFAGIPNGNVLVTTTKPCVCYDSLNDVFWVKTDGAFTNTGWIGP